MSRTHDLHLIAKNFLVLAARGDVRKAFSLYAADGFRHHNAFFKGDTESLITAMEEAARENPGTVLEVKRVLQDGSQVAVHSHVVHKPGDAGFAVVHLFRFHEDKIAEMWDVIQAVPEKPVNENGMF